MTGGDHKLTVTRTLSCWALLVVGCTTFRGSVCASPAGHSWVASTSCIWSTLRSRHSLCHQLSLQGVWMVQRHLETLR